MFNRSWPLIEIGDLYDYYAERWSWPESRHYDPVNHVRFRELLDHLGSLTTGRRLLDVGCGVGHLVKVAQEQGWAALGIETSPSAVEIAKKHDINCRVQDLFSEALDDARFDVITLVEVIEHVTEPAGFLSRAESLLTAGGVLYVTTPNFGSIARRLLRGSWPLVSQEHISYFEPETFARMARDQTNLDVISVSTRNVSPGMIMNAVSKRRSSCDPSEWAGSPSAAPDYALRRRMEESPTLGALKQVVNRVLHLTRSGDTLVVALKRGHEAPPQPR